MWAVTYSGRCFVVRSHLVTAAIVGGSCFGRVGCLSAFSGFCNLLTQCKDPCGHRVLGYVSAWPCLLEQRGNTAAEALCSRAPWCATVHWSSHNHLPDAVGFSRRCMQSSHLGPHPVEPMGATYNQELDTIGLPVTNQLDGWPKIKNEHEHGILEPYAA